MSTEEKKYKKRVIQQESSDDDSDHDVPLAKKPKPSSPTLAASVVVPPIITSTSTDPTAPSLPLPPPPTTSTTDVVPMQVDEIPKKIEPISTEEAKELEKEKKQEEKKKLDVFTTGDSDDDSLSSSSGKKKVNGNGNGNGKKRGKDEEEEEDTDDDDSDDEDDQPLSAKVKSNGNGKGNGNGKVKEEEDDSDDSDDEPLKATKNNANAKASSSKPPPASKPKSSKSKAKPKSEDEEEEDEDEESEAEPTDSDSEDEMPLKSKAKSKSKAKPKPNSKSKSKAAPKPKSAPAKKKVKKEDSVAGSPVVSKVNGKGKGKKGKKEEDNEEEKEKGGNGSESEEEVYKWWEQEDDGVTKWKTLEHSGVLFPPEYEAHGVKMNYEGKPVDLPPESEEVASFFAAMLESDHVKNPTFVKNFFDSFLGVLKSHPPLDKTKIKLFTSCDFRPIWSYLEAERLKKKEMTSAQKKAAKADRDVIEEKYKTCLLDGRKEKVGNFRVEPPGLFRGRGEHPKTGLLKTRVRPEQITINIGKDAVVPEPPAGHKWNNVVHDDKVTWLATWKENINGAVKYVFLAAGSSLKGQSDFKKFEKARALKEHVDRIRRDYTADLSHKEMVTRQRATAIYLIDRFALRNGNEKGEDEADTVGCCSLRYEHVTLEPPNKVTFDFLGKDSIRYTNTVEVDDKVFKNLKIFKKDPKTVGDLLFDRLTTGIVNKYLTSYMDGLTAKVFRTYNASWTFVEQLKDTPKDVSVADKILAYNRANRLVAVLCNHQRSVSKGHGVVMEKMADKIRALKYQRRKLRFALLASAGDSKKKYKEFKEDESDIDDEWIEKHEVNLVVLEREKIRKKFDKDNKKLEEENEKPMTEKDLNEKLKAADELEKTLKAEKKKGWKESKLAEDKLVAAINKIDERIQVAKTAAVDRDEGKEISLGTSKINYLDPRITFQWAAANDVPINKLLSKTLIEKFTWAADAGADFEW